MREVVKEFIHRQDQLGAFSGIRTVRFASWLPLEFHKPDRAIHRVEFLDDSSSESLVLTIDFAYRAWLD